MKRCEHCNDRLGLVILGRWTSGVVTCRVPEGHSFITEVPALPKRPRKPVHKMTVGGRVYALKSGERYFTSAGRLFRRI